MPDLIDQKKASHKTLHILISEFAMQIGLNHPLHPKEVFSL
jgi:hypothetical protein